MICGFISMINWTLIDIDDNDNDDVSGYFLWHIPQVTKKMVEQKYMSAP